MLQSIKLKTIPIILKKLLSAYRDLLVRIQPKSWYSIADSTNKDSVSPDSTDAMLIPLAPDAAVMSTSKY